MMSGEAGPIDNPNTSTMLARAMADGRCVMSTTTTTAVGPIVTVQLRTMSSGDAEREEGTV